MKAPCKTDRRLPMWVRESSYHNIVIISIINFKNLIAVHELGKDILIVGTSNKSIIFKILSSLFFENSIYWILCLSKLFYILWNRYAAIMTKTELGYVREKELLFFFILARELVRSCASPYPRTDCILFSRITTNSLRMSDFIHFFIFK